MQHLEVNRRRDDLPPRGRESVQPICSRPCGVIHDGGSPSSFDLSLRLWNTETGREIFTIEKHPQSFHGVAFSPDGMRLAAGMDNGIIKFFDAPAEQEVTTLRGHTDTVIQFSFSDDGRQIYSESGKEELYWDLTTKTHDPDATWDPAATHTQSPGSREASRCRMET